MVLARDKEKCLPLSYCLLTALSLWLQGLRGLAVTGIPQLGWLPMIWSGMMSLTLTKVCLPLVRLWLCRRCDFAGALSVVSCFTSLESCCCDDLAHFECSPFQLPFFALYRVISSFISQHFQFIHSQFSLVLRSSVQCQLACKGRFESRSLWRLSCLNILRHKPGIKSCFSELSSEQYSLLLNQVYGHCQCHRL